MAVHRERHTRGYVYVVSDRFSRTSYACERVRPIAAAIRASASRADDAVSASQLHAHAAGRVGGLLKHRWSVQRLHAEDEATGAALDSLARSGRDVVCLCDKELHARMSAGTLFAHAR